MVRVVQICQYRHRMMFRWHMVRVNMSIGKTTPEFCNLGVVGGKHAYT